MPDLPGVSMLCPTFGRAPRHLFLLEECVECFRRCAETYGGPCELVILNDAPEQRIVCDLPGVRVVNEQPRRYGTLGEKRNALAGLARFDIFLPTDDDDLSLPNRASQAVERLASSGAGYWNPRAYWFDQGRGIEAPGSVGYCHNCSAFTREAFEAAGGYPATSGDEDALMDARLRASCEVAEGTLPPAEWSYVYRWGVSPRHLSGRPDLQRHYDEIGGLPVAPGAYTIRPRWRRDYAAEARAAAARPAGLPRPGRGR